MIKKSLDKNEGLHIKTYWCSVCVLANQSSFDSIGWQAKTKGRLFKRSLTKNAVKEIFESPDFYLPLRKQFL